MVRTLLSISKIFRYLAERRGFKVLIGLPLVIGVFVNSTLYPYAHSLISLYSLTSKSTPLATNVNINPETLTTFGMPLSNFRFSQGFSGFHPGIDLPADKGTPIQAIEKGKVIYAGNTYIGYGKHVLIEHEGSITTLSAHMSDISVSPGQEVTRGDVIGTVGSTGFSTGNHLHLEVHQLGKPVNPVEVLPFVSQVKK